MVFVRDISGKKTIPGIKISISNFIKFGIPIILEFLREPEKLLNYRDQDYINSGDFGIVMGVMVKSHSEAASGYSHGIVLNNISSSDESDSEDEVIKEARFVLSDSVNARLFKETPNLPEPTPIRNMNFNNNINLARASPQSNHIGNKIVNGRIERLQERDLETSSMINIHRGVCL